MKIVSIVAQKIAQGLLYGIGFGVSAGAIYYFVSEKMIAAAWKDAEIENIVVTKHEKVQRGDATQVLGTVENKGKNSVRLINVQIDLFDKNGKFVDQCAEYLKGSIRAGESVNFKVTCGGCKDKPVVEHESYKVRVTGI